MIKYILLMGLTGAVIGAIAGLAGGVLKMFFGPYWLGMPMVWQGMFLSPLGGAIAGLVVGLLGGLGVVGLEKRWGWIVVIGLSTLFGCLCGWLPFVYMSQ
jgi:hypothetical protein